MSRLLAAVVLLGGCAPAAVPPPAAPPEQVETLAAVPPAEDRGPQRHPDPRVSFAADAIPFRAALQRLARLSGVPLTWDPALGPEILDAPVSLELVDAPLPRACDWLGRQVDLHPLGANDPAAPGGRAWHFVTWEAAAPERGPWALTRVDVGPLVTPPPPPPLMVQRSGSLDRVVGRPDPAAKHAEPEAGQPARRVPLGSPGPDPAEGILRELDGDLEKRRLEEVRLRQDAAKSLLEVLRPLAFTTYEHPRPCYFLPGHPSQLMIDQPVRGRAWVVEAARGMTSPFPPSGIAPEDEAGVADLERAWSTPVTLPGDEMDTEEVLKVLARQGGVSVGWDRRELSGALLRRVKGLPSRGTFGAVLHEVARKAGFLRVLREPGMGVWLLGPREAASAPRARSLQSCTLGVYPIGDLDRLLGGPAVVGLLRSRLDAGTWEEAGAVLAFHPASARLVVRHRPDVHVGVLALLALLRREGTLPFGSAAP